MAGRQTLSPDEQSIYANETELDASDIALVEEIAEDSGRDPEDREEGSLTDDDALYMDVSAHPASETTAISETSGYEETEDGLSDLEETIRQQAEDRALGDDEDFIA
ncbi:hypothetical protein [Chthonobacter rhizosphaerae]|uniref:hypothetical protein n=1 Tax=Chthonobacter rhizosphaerae TaxID=2735553 RepID=UPI0015EEDF9D|nr:hypothetical protein [Chthonobacter rhizosphaerae]